jgi:hypothetical protein
VGVICHCERSEAISQTEGLAQNWLFGHGWPYTFAPQEWRANVMPAAYRFVATLLAMTTFYNEIQL